MLRPEICFIQLNQQHFWDGKHLHKMKYYSVSIDLMNKEANKNGKKTTTETQNIELQ